MPCIIRWRRGSPALRQRLQATLERHFAAGKTSLASGELEPIQLASQHDFSRAEQRHDSEGFSPEVPIIVFANEFFDALPVEVLSPQGELRIAEKDGRLLETWNAPSAEAWSSSTATASIPKPERRIEASLIAQRYMSPDRSHDELWIHRRH